MTRTTRTACKEQVRERLLWIADQAKQATQVPVLSEDLCDLLDDIDNEVQRVIALVQEIRDGGMK